MNIIEIQSLQQPGIDVFSTLTEAQLRNVLDPARGQFIAESPKVINVALDAGYEPLAVLCERRHIEGDAAGLLARCPAEMPVYTGPRELLAQLTGYTLTRGVLCAMRRPTPRTVASVCGCGQATDEAPLPPTRIVVIDGVVDATNVGAIFRSAAALGIDGILLTRNTCDPLNRRAVRVSMGSVFLVPWAWLDDPLDSLHAYQLRTAALALTHRSVSITDAALQAEPRLALVMGTEGDGLPAEVIAACDYTVRIPMYHNVDSLNVAAASAVACWELRKNRS